MLRLDREPPAFGHGVTRVDRQVHEDLLDLPGVRLDAAQAGLQGRRQLDVLPDEPPQHLLHVGDDGVEIEDPGLKDLLSAEGEQLPRQARGPLAPP